MLGMAGLPELLDVIQVSYENLMIHCCPELPRLEEVYAVQICDVDSPVIIRQIS